MWDSIFGLIPEKRQPGALSVLAFFSIVLPIIAAVAALAAWKLNDRLSRHRPPSAQVRSDLLPIAAAPEAAGQEALLDAQVHLRETEHALHETELELEKEKERARAALASTHRRVSISQRQKFLKFALPRPKGRVVVTALEDDSECQSYAEELRSLLSTAGYEVGDTLGTLRYHGEPPVGLRIGAYSKDSAPPHALPLSSSFIEADIFAPAVINPKVARGEVEVTVGVNPATANDDSLAPVADLPRPEDSQASTSDKKVVAP